MLSVELSVSRVFNSESIVNEKTSKIPEHESGLKFEYGYKIMLSNGKETHYPASSNVAVKLSKEPEKTRVLTCFYICMRKSCEHQP